MVTYISSINREKWEQCFDHRQTFIIDQLTYSIAPSDASKDELEELIRNMMVLLNGMEERST